MINIFISYCNKDEDKAKILQKTLNNRANPNIKSQLVPFETTSVERSSDKIARFIDFSDVFVVLYTENAKNSVWVNQEIGYAFNHNTHSSLTIFILYKNRDDIEGFISSNEYNISKDFKLEDDNMIAFKKLKAHIIENYEYPIEINIEQSKKYPNLAGTPGSNKIMFSIQIENKANKVLRNCSIHFVSQPDINIKPSLDQFPSRKYKEEKFHYETSLLPTVHRRKFSIEGKIFYRLSIDLADIDEYSLKENLLTVKFNKNFNEFDIGIYFQAPLIGSRYYRLQVLENGKNINFEQLSLRSTVIIRKPIII